MNHMAPHIDDEARLFGREGETPTPRFGSEHIVRDTVPAVYPEISDFSELQERREKAFLDDLELRSGQIAVADTVELRLEAFAS